MRILFPILVVGLIVFSSCATSEFQRGPSSVDENQGSAPWCMVEKTGARVCSFYDLEQCQHDLTDNTSKCENL